MNGPDDDPLREIEREAARYADRNTTPASPAPIATGRGWMILLLVAAIAALALLWRYV